METYIFVTILISLATLLSGLIVWPYRLPIHAWWRNFISHEGQAFFVLTASLVGTMFFLELLQNMYPLLLPDTWLVAVVIAIMYLPDTYANIRKRSEPSWLINFACSFRCGFMAVGKFITYLLKQGIKIQQLYNYVRNP